MEEQHFFETNPQKSANKVTINSFMMGSLFMILVLIITLGPANFSQAIIFQLVLAVPLLYVASLAYSKIGYWREIHNWNALGWFTNTTGNLFIINAIGLLASKFDQSLAWIYFSLFGVLMIVYTLINIKHNRQRWYFKALKLLYLLIVVLLGGIIFI
jgi:hypothetical protein